MSKNLKYFMREAAEVEKVVTVPAPESFKDENGKVIQLEVKVLSSERIRAINEGYHTHTVALDKKGNPYINGGNVVSATSATMQRPPVTSSLRPCSTPSWTTRS